MPTRHPAASSSLCTNGFIANHLVYFLMFTGFEIMCVTTEWVGYEYHFHCETHNKLSRYLPLIGHSVFVVFVSLAYMLPPSAMSGIVFLVGITQLGYPEMIMRSFNAAGLVVEDLCDGEEEESNEETPKERRATYSEFVLGSYSQEAPTTQSSVSMAMGSIGRKSSLYRRRKSSMHPGQRSVEGFAALVLADIWPTHVNVNLRGLSGIAMMPTAIQNLGCLSKSCGG